MIPLLAALMLMTVAAEPGDAVLTLLDGSTHAGRIASWNADGVAINGPDGSSNVERNVLLDVRWQRAETPPANPTRMCLELTDGTRLAITAFTAAGRVATIETPYAPGPIKISAEQIRRV